ncbi:MAG: DUF721 domain-containing protein [Saprospiraceae bacterium]
MGRQNDKNIKDVLKDFISSDARISKGFYTTEIDEIWRKEMGPIISGYTKKLYFKDGVLKIYLTSAPLKKELLMGKANIIQIINDAVGMTLVTKVEVY